MSDPDPHTELLRSLGRLARGLSALFWGLPVTLLVCFHTVRAEFFNSLGPLPSIITTAWLFYGLWQLGAFQKQERIWRNALDRARILAFINVGLSPFLYWHNRLPSNEFFFAVICVMGVSGLIFLASLNVVLKRLGAMLPDETLRVETQQFTALNHRLLFAMLLLGLGYFALKWLPPTNLPEWSQPIAFMIDRVSIFMLIPLLLLPLAMTMALLWKTKQVILDSVFSGKA